MSRDLPEAKKRWSLFHQKDNPRELITVAKAFPKRWCLAGRAVTTYYSSDKWNPDGKFDGYYHEHSSEAEGGVWVYVPVGTFRWADEEKLPISKFPDAGAVLGTCDGFDFERADSGKLVEGYAGKDALLCCSPDGKFLFVYDPSDGVVAIVTGDPIEVLAEGISG